MVKNQPRRRSCQRYSWSQLLLVSVLLPGLLLGTTACNRPNRAFNKLAQDTKQLEDFDSSLTFNDVTLEQADEKGRLWWKVKAKQASYSKDQRVARIQTPTGELYQDGRAVFEVKAASGEVQQDGNKIFLRGQIIATDLRDGTVLKGNELEWRPKEDVLFVRNGFTGDHRQMQVTAQEGRYQTRSKQMELLRQVVATAKNPTAQIRTDQLRWDVGQGKVRSDRPVQIDRYEGQTVTDRATANQAGFDLKTRVATLSQNAQLALAKSGLQVTSNNLVWSLNSQTAVADQPITLVQQKQQVTMTADRGQMDLRSQTVTLNGNVRGVGQRNQAQLQANQLIWFLQTQQFEAEGRVVYRQANPPFNLMGPKARGTLQGQNVVVSGGRVITEITPQGRL